MSRLVLPAAVLAAAVAATPAPAAADDAAPAQPPSKVAAAVDPARPTPPPREPGAVATPAPDPAAPVPPDRASGVAVEEQAPATDRLRWIPRIVLFAPRWAFWAAAQPVRLGAYVEERYQVRARTKALLFSADETYGIYPIGTYSTDFGVGGGARFVHHDLLGAREDLRVQATFEGRADQAFRVALSSGDRLGARTKLELDTSLELGRRERWYGLGNAAPATATVLSDDVIRSVATADIRVAGPLHARASAALMMRDFADAEPATAAAIADATGGNTAVDHAYVEGELIYDSRRPTSRYQADPFDATGWLAAVHVGRAAGVDGDRTAFTRYGGELQRFIDLYRGSRVLALRVAVEAVAAADGRIAPIDLPRLGGTSLLRGYSEGRFRDRAIAAATAEYTWDLGNFLAAYTFVDAGRAWSSLDDASLDALRVGFGGGIQIHTQESFLVRGQLAASRDGDVFVELALAPAFSRRDRAGRY